MSHVFEVTPREVTSHCSEAYQAPSLSFTVHTHPITVPVLGNLPRLDDGILWWVMSGFLSALVGESPYSLDIQTVKVYASEVHISAQEMFGCQGFLFFLSQALTVRQKVEDGKKYIHLVANTRNRTTFICICLWLGMLPLPTIVSKGRS